MKNETQIKAKFPTVGNIKRVVDAARAAGIDVASIEIIDNAIQVFDVRALAILPSRSDEFAKWDMDGRL